MKAFNYTQRFSRSYNIANFNTITAIKALANYNKGSPGVLHFVPQNNKPKHSYYRYSDYLLPSVCSQPLLSIAKSPTIAAITKKKETTE